jgi:DNA-directed RNA polymerase specialized sigma24 family protein
MSSQGSGTNWFDQIERGDSLAAQALWECYFPKLVHLARAKLEGMRRAAADEEDVALSALRSFFAAAQKGRFPNLADRDDLWRLLIQITAQKAIDLRRRENCQRRGGGRVKGESALIRPGSDSDHQGLSQVIGDAPTPEFAATTAEECRRLLEQLDDSQMQAIAVAKMEGYTNREISDRLDCSTRTVERRLPIIREKWEGEL